MSGTDKQKLLEFLTKVHLATHKTLEEVDLDTLVHTDSGWRIRDIIGHVATWHQNVAIAVNEYRAGSEYLVPDLDEEEVEYNEQAVSEQRKLSTPQLIAEWEQAYDELKKAIQDMPEDRFPGDILFPWGDERGSIKELVDYMIEHEIEHREEIEKIVG